ncbi:MAG: hypothetical protein ACP5D7_07080 [Limnospira sp.]
MEFPECTEENNNSKITIVDKNSKNTTSQVILDNPNRKKIKIIQIEDCVITKGTKGGRCDQLIVVPDDRCLIFIELKGNDVPKAIAQLIDSLNYIKQKCSSIQSHTIHCLIACTRCPLNSTQVQNEKKKFKKKYQARLKINSGKTPYKI